MPLGVCAETGKARSPTNAIAPAAALLRVAALSKCLLVCMASSRRLTRNAYRSSSMLGRSANAIFETLTRHAAGAGPGRDRCGVGAQALAFSGEASASEKNLEPASAVGCRLR